MLEQTRQLAAIMFTDIVGYTKLMQQDEKRRSKPGKDTGKYLIGLPGNTRERSCNITGMVRLVFLAVHRCGGVRH